MPDHQFDLFSSNRTGRQQTYVQSGRQEWFLASHPAEWQEREYRRALKVVRTSLPTILESLRDAEKFPWLPNELRAVRIIVHNRSSWLPSKECAEVRQAFHEKLTHWKELRQLPKHEPINPALLTRRTDPPAQDCPRAEWEVAGISPIADDDGFYGKVRPLPLDQDTYVLWPGAFEPRTIAPSPPQDGEGVLQKPVGIP